MMISLKQRRLRKGNALILVVSILVLLVLVATAFITRVQSGRFTAIAQRDASRINDRSHMIGQSVSNEIAIALFPKPVIWEPGGSTPLSANARRVTPYEGALRYGHDKDAPYNFAPYEVIPWTNPPASDPTMLGIPIEGPSNPWGGPSFGDTRWLRDTEPQRADLNDMMDQGIWSVSVDGTPETFTHWRHLTNISRSGNAWRVVRDISDVVGGGLVDDLDVPIEQWPINRPLDVFGGRLAIAIGSTRYPSMDYDGDGTPDGEEHLRRWGEWFTLTGWADAQLNAKELPQNFLDLSDLNADGIHNDYGERAADAFVPYTSRWYAELMMTDADGDGFTDSLWHLSPQTLGPDVRQIVAFSVTDNSALGNMNVATRFHRKDFYNTDTDLDKRGEATRGLTPADLAIVGQNDFFTATNVYPWRVGFMDTLANLPGHSYFSYPSDSTLFPGPGEKWVVYDEIGSSGAQVNVDWNTNQWDDRGNSSLLDELGIEFTIDSIDFVNDVFKDPTNGHFLSPTDDITSRYGRLWYWQLAGRDPFVATKGLRPFTIPDELELRIAEGNNYQFVGSRFERSINDIIGQYSNGVVSNQFLRSDYQRRQETGELRDQLDNRQLLFDNRRKLTMFSGVRNDLLPPWLRWEDRFWNRNDPNDILPFGYTSFDSAEYPEDLFRHWGSLFPTKIVFEAGQAGADAWDQDDPGAYLIAITNATKNWREQSRQKVDLREYYADSSIGPPWWESDNDGNLTLFERAPLQILLAMTDMQEEGTGGLILTPPAPVDSHGPLGPYSTPDPDAAWDTINTNYYQQTRLMAAGFASNLLAYRDDDDQWRQHSMKPMHPAHETIQESPQPAIRAYIPLSAAIAPPVLGNQGYETNVVVPDIGEPPPYADVPVLGPDSGDVMMLGIEAQPFILEVFIAHVHQAKGREPEGACCLHDAFGGLAGGCVEVSESTCDGLLAGTFFEGGLCDPNGDGDFDDGPCEKQGACCTLGSCLVMSENACLQASGEFLGEIPCADAICNGACCTDSGDCVDMSGYSCAQVGGTYAGNDTLCDEIPCVMLGSCCMSSGTCMTVISSNACDSLDGLFVSGAKCSEFPCLGACCVEFADCLQVTEGGCDDIGGNFLGTDQVCTTTICVASGTCCIGSNSCHEVQSSSECDTLNGTFLSGQNCADAPCSGACCLGDGECQDVSLVTCIDLSTEFGIELEYIEDGNCATNPCRSSCCLSSGGCEDLLQVLCDDYDGVFIGGGILCDTSPCSPVGACCLPDDPDDPSDGGCIEVMDEGCTILAGEYQGDGVSCGTVPCGSSSIRGACCLPAGCQNVVSEQVCATLGGIYQGDLISCAETPCVPAEACCLDDATCIDVIADLCLLLEGDSQIGFTCADRPCVTACCFAGLVCLDMTEAACVTAGGTSNDQRLCDSSPCESEAACCIGSPFSTVCDVFTESDCDALGGQFQGEGTDCTGTTCALGDKGACCMSPLGCMVVVESACLLAGGSFSAGSCDTTDACNTGSCCLQDGGSGHCIQIVDEAACQSLLGGVFIAGGECSDRECLGACCIWGGDCVVMSKESCETLWDPDADGDHDPEDPPGVFNGVGTTCAADTCPPTGSCCLASDTCVDTFEVFSLTSDGLKEYCSDTLGGTFRPGELCADTECGGSCCLPDGTCMDISAAACSSFAGTYNLGAFCDSDPCGPVWKCCFPSGSCHNLPLSGCDLLGGEWRDGEICDPDDKCQAYYLVNYSPGVDGVYDTIDDPCPQETIAVVQLANPFDRAIDLNQYSVEFFGQEFKLDGLDLVLPPATPANPATLILYSISDDSDIQDPITFPSSKFKDDWLDFLDIEVTDHPFDDNPGNDNPVTLEGYVGTVFVDVNERGPNWSTSRDYYDLLDYVDVNPYDNPRLIPEQNSVALYKFDKSSLQQNGTPLWPTQRVLIDRLDPPNPTINSIDEPFSFEERVVSELEEEWLKVGTRGYIVLEDFHNPDDDKRIPAEDLLQSALYVQWDRATRAWGTDMPVNGGWHNDMIDAWEHNPRFIFAARDFIREEDSMTVTNALGAIAGNQGIQADITYASAFHWTEFVTPDDFDGNGNPDNAHGEADDDLLSDDSDAWFTVEVWSPRAGEFRSLSTITEGEVTGEMRFRKPTYFDMNHKEDPAYDSADPFESNPNLQPWSYMDKGWYGQRDDDDGDETSSDTPAFADDIKVDGFISFDDGEVDMAMAFPLQMLQKDEDFEQVGELLNVWLFGHMLEGDYFPEAGMEPTDYEYKFDVQDVHLSWLDGGTAADAGTITTFSEFMYPRWYPEPIDQDLEELGHVRDWWAPWVATIQDNEIVLGERVNRLRFLPDGDDVHGDGVLPLMMDGRTSSSAAIFHAWPRLPIASRIIDSFVCDGPGRPDWSGDNVGDDLLQAASSVHSFYNANGFTGKSTPGIININTAPVEVLRMLPHMYKVVHATHQDDAASLDSVDRNPRSLIPESIVQWREGANGKPNLLSGTGFTGGFDYSNRSATVGMALGVKLKETRGFSSPSEIGLLRPLLDSSAYNYVVDNVYEPWHVGAIVLDQPSMHQAIRDVNSWRIDFAAAEPFFGLTGLRDETFVDMNNNDVFDPGIDNPYEHTVGGKISTDVNFTNYYGENTLSGDGVSGDSEELNLLQAGMSNLISTTSDMFTVHFRIRTFRRNPMTGIWNATDPDYIIDDSRYLMLVDRSNVNVPADKPRILYFEKLPN